MKGIEECLIRGEDTESVSIRLPKHVYVLLREIAQREEDFRNITGIIRRGLYVYLFPKFVQEAGDTLATEGYPLHKGGVEREAWAEEKESRVYDECKAVKKFAQDLITQIEEEEKSYFLTFGEIQEEGHEKYRQALKIVYKVQEGKMDRKEADKELKKILGWGNSFLNL